MKKVVFTAGVWDLLHYGHVRFLQQCAALGDHLDVGVLTDEAAMKYKTQPVMSYAERDTIVRALGCVGSTVMVHDSDATPQLRHRFTGAPYQILILAHGSDWKPGWEIGQTWTQSVGGLFVLLPYTEGISTTEIRRRILSGHSDQPVVD